MSDHNAVLWPCHGGRNQRWEIRGEEVVSTKNGYCLTYTGEDARLRSCNGRREQRWRWSEGGHSDRLMTGEALFRGQNLTAGRVRLGMQEDGDLVLYNGKRWGGEYAIWRTRTREGHRAELGEDGQLRVLSRDGRTLWASKNRGRATQARLHDDCRFALYEADCGSSCTWRERLWSTYTYCSR